MCFQARAGQAWVAFQSRIDAQLEPFGRKVLERLMPQSGARVLDVGCGTGQTAIQLAELVGPRGEVVGIDVSEPMLECAEERLQAGGYMQVDLLLDDAQTHVFLDRYFDLAFSRFGLMFFEDALAGFSNVCRALRRGGRLGFVCWQSRELNPWAAVPLAAALAVSPSLVSPPFLDSDQPGPFSLADPEKLRSILSASGFTGIELTEVKQPLHFGAAMTLSDAVAYGLRVGPASRVIAEADQKLLPAFGQALEDALRPYLTPTGVWLDSAAWLAYAERA
jgi:ubiquinone/menaquinone biosynthesis C-methylase UbiE